MNDTLWRWMLRLNVRAVFLLALAVLAATLYTVSRDRAAPLPPAISTDGDASGANRDGATRDFTGIFSREVPELTKNPFVSSYLTDYVRRERERRLAAEAARRQAEEEARRKAAEAEAARKAAEAEQAAAQTPPQKPPPTQPEPEKPAPPAKPAPTPPPDPAPPAEKPRDEPAEPAPPKVVKLIYRGMMKRTDGLLVAMIENVTSGEMAFLPPGETFGDYRVESVTRNRLVLILRDNSRLELPPGQELVIKE